MRPAHRRSLPFCGLTRTDRGATTYPSMKVLSLDALAESLVCPMCRGGQLCVVGSDPALRCVACSQVYTTEHGVVSFLVPDQLSKTNVGEISANTYADEARATWILDREDWNPLLTHQMKWVIET